MTSSRDVVDEEETNIHNRDLEVTNVDGHEPGEILLEMEPPIKFIDNSATSNFNIIAGGVAVLVPEAMGYDSDTESNCRMDSQSNGQRSTLAVSDDDSDLVVVRPEAPILDITQFGLPHQDDNSGKGWPFGKRPKRNYSPDERKRRLQSAVDEVLTNQTSLRLAADKWDVAKSSLCDYIRKNNIYVPNLRKNQHPTPEGGSTPVKRSRINKKPLSSAKATALTIGFSTLSENKDSITSSSTSDRLTLATAFLTSNSLISASSGASLASGSSEQLDTVLRVIAPKRLESAWSSNGGGLPTQVPFSNMPVYGAIAFPGASPLKGTSVSISTTNKYEDIKDNDNDMDSVTKSVPDVLSYCRSDNAQQLEERLCGDEDDWNENNNDSDMDTCGLRIPLVPFDTHDSQVKCQTDKINFSSNSYTALNNGNNNGVALNLISSTAVLAPNQRRKQLYYQQLQQLSQQSSFSLSQQNRVTATSTAQATSEQIPSGFRILCSSSLPISSCGTICRVNSPHNQPRPFILEEHSAAQSPDNSCDMASSNTSSRALLLSKGLVDYINASPSPFHAVASARARLESAGFVHMDESQPFDLVNHRKFFITRNSSSLIAIALGAKYQDGNGFSIVGAHTDSPCLKVKPISQRIKEGYHQVGVEAYGGGIWFTWFDRDLTVAGRVLVRTAEGRIAQQLVHVPRPILRIPTLAIHLNRSVNEGFTPNKESHLLPLLCSVAKEELMNNDAVTTATLGANQTNKHSPALLRVISEQLNCKIDDIVDFDLCLADTQDAAIGGTHNEFIFAPRLDNLFNCYAGVEGMVQALSSLEQDSMARVLCLYDNEEVGSRSAQGAMSSFTELILRRIAPAHYEESFAKSYLVSADQAHATHPNYSDVHDSAHRPAFHKGIVLKTNNCQSYATTAVTRTLITEIAARAGVPLQHFINRQDMGCGSTIGPILSAKLGIPTSDIGGPMLSMHSCREMCCISSVAQTIDLLAAFYQHFEAVRDSFI